MSTFYLSHFHFYIARVKTSLMGDRSERRLVSINLNLAWKTEVKIHRKKYQKSTSNSIRFKHTAGSQGLHLQDYATLWIEDQDQTSSCLIEVPSNHHIVTINTLFWLRLLRKSVTRSSFARGRSGGWHRPELLPHMTAVSRHPAHCAHDCLTCTDGFMTVVHSFGFLFVKFGDSHDTLLKKGIT